MTYSQLYDLIYQQIRRYLKVPQEKIIRTTDDLSSTSPTGDSTDNTQTQGNQEPSSGPSSTTQELEIGDNESRPIGSNSVGLPPRRVRNEDRYVHSLSLSLHPNLFHLEHSSYLIIPQ